MKILRFDSFINEEEQEEKWWKKYAKYQLSKYPVNIPEEDVKVDLTGDIDSHPVLTWTSPTTGKKVYSYTKKRIETQQADKYARIEKLSQGQVEKMKVFCHNVITGEETDKKKQAAAVVSIIAQTGLRPGSKKGFEETQNRGVTTLSVSNIHIDGSVVKLDFVGKSYKKNVAEFEDGVVANYLATHIKNMDSHEFVFNISRDDLEAFMRVVPKMDRFKVKDLRTHIANRIALDFLEKDPTPPPPVPDNSEDIKKAVKRKLKLAFDYVSKKLNNSPAMAKGSYVDPSVINKWLHKLGITQTAGAIAEDEGKEEFKVIGNAPVYELPEWWNNEDIELKKR